MWRCRPSELLAIEDEIAAYSFDRAVMLFGTALENELEEAVAGIDKDPHGLKAEQARKRILKKWIPEASSETTPQYRDPAGTVGQRGERGGEVMTL